MSGGAQAIVPPRTVPGPAALAAGVAAGLALAAAYAANLAELARVSWSDPNYSHGYLVVPIALAILWRRRRDLAAVRPEPTWLGWAALVGVLALRLWLFERNEQWMESATIPLAAAALVLALGGWTLLWRAAPAVAFLGLMLPLPPRLNLAMAGPLQGLAARGSTFLLDVLGLPALRDGNTILIGPQRLEVERACNGLSMIMAFVTLVAATAILIRSRPMWERVVLLLSTVPIALLSNVLRIAVTGVCYYRLGRDWGDRVVHDTAGLAMMPIALVLVVLELRLLSWLVVEEVVDTRPRLVLPPSYAAPRPAPKKPAPEGGDGSAGAVPE